MSFRDFPFSTHKENFFRGKKTKLFFSYLLHGLVCKEARVVITSVSCVGKRVFLLLLCMICCESFVQFLLWHRYIQDYSGQKVAKIELLSRS